MYGLGEWLTEWREEAGELGKSLIRETIPFLFSNTLSRGRGRMGERDEDGGNSGAWDVVVGGIRR